MKKICFKPKNRVKCNENFGKVKFLSTYEMVKFNFGLGGDDDAKKDDGQSPQTDDTTAQTTDPVVEEVEKKDEEIMPSKDIEIEKPEINVKSDEEAENAVEATEDEATENNEVVETKENETPEVGEDTPTEDVIVPTVETEEAETKTETEEPTASDPFAQTESTDTESPFAVDTKETGLIEDPFSVEDTKEEKENPFGGLASKEEEATTKPEKTEATPVIEEAPVATKNPFGENSNDEVAEETVSENPFGGGFGGNDAASGTTNDPLQTLGKLKEEIKNFVEAKKTRIAELNKEISDRKNEIKDEEKALADKQKEFATMLADIQTLTGEFDGKKKTAKK